jgi:hypothetical protein
MESHKIHIPNHQPDEYEHIYIKHDWTENTHVYDDLHKLNAIMVGGALSQPKNHPCMVKF